MNKLRLFLTLYQFRSASTMWCVTFPGLSKPNNSSGEHAHGLKRKVRRKDVNLE